MNKTSLIAGFLFIVIVSAIFFLVNNNSITGEVVNLGEKTVYMTLFYGQGCPHCAQLEAYLSDLESKGYKINVTMYEVYNNQKNRDLWDKYSKAYNSKIEGVPTLFIGDKVFVGFNNEIGNQIKDEITKCSSEICINPALKVGGETTQISGNSSPSEKPSTTLIKNSLTIPTVIAAAAVDSINPCEFAVLILLLTTILAAGDRKKALFAGLAFSLAIFISYFLMGLGLYSAIQATGLSRGFYIAVSILAILVGLFNLKDYLWYGKGFLMEVPLSWRPLMKRILSSVTSVPGAFIVGVIISLFLLPCTSGPYIVILGLLAGLTTKMTGVMFLILYNFIFVLPMLIITMLIYFGITSTEQAEEWRTRKLRILHLITGTIILLLGIGMIISVVFGWI